MTKVQTYGGVMVRSITAALCASVVVGTASAAAQPRLFARAGDTVLEVGTTPATLGRVVAQIGLPACGPVSGATVPTGSGRHLVWSHAGGVCLLDVLTGHLRRLDIAGAQSSSLAAVAVQTFGVVVNAMTSTGASLYALAAPDAELVAMPLPAALPRVVRHVAVAPDGHTVVVVLADRGDPQLGEVPSARILRLDMRTGQALSVSTVAEPLGVTAVVVDRSGTLVFMASADPNVGTRGVFLVHALTGLVTQRRTDIEAIYATDVHTRGNVLLLLTPDESTLAVTTYAGLLLLSPWSFADQGTVDVPRARLALQPGNDVRSLAFDVQFDAGSGTLFALEHEGQSRSYHPGTCLRSTLWKISTNRPAMQADLVEMYGAPRCGSAGALFLLPSVRPPVVTSVVTSYPSGYPQYSGATVELAWHGSPGVQYYEVEGGRSPGAATFRLRVDDLAWARVTDVPAGTYYVRVRAVGAAGVAVSPEVRIRV